MTKLELKDVIKLVRELKKFGTLSKKKRKRTQRINTCIKLKKSK
jgi:hypothetical protein